MNSFQHKSELTYIDEDRWQAFVRERPESTTFHHVNWLTLLARQYGLRIRIPALVVGHSVHAGMPFIETRKPWKTRRLVSLPFTDCVRPLARSANALQQWAASLPDFLASDYRYAILKTDCPVAGDPQPSPIVRHEMALDLSFDEIEDGFPASLKRNVRRAENRDLRYEIATDVAALDVFYRLHVLTRRKLGVPVQPKSFFQRLHTQIIQEDLGEISLTKMGDEVLAAAIWLKFNTTQIFKYGASNPQKLEVRPNDFLYYYSIKRAAETGMKYVDFGTSEMAQDGLRRFKRKWGAVESPVYYDHFLGKPKPSSATPSVLTRLAGSVIRRSPTALCRVLGEVLYRYSA